MLAAISAELAQLEMHILAYFYHWSRDSVVSMPRRERRMWVNQIREQIKAENKSNK